MDIALSQRFLDKVEFTEGCWLWKAYVDPGGYGRFTVQGKSLYAHRVAFGPEIPEDKVVDHVCRNRRCVRPDHLRLLTRAENTRRGTGGTHKGFCRRGHDLSIPENVGFTIRRSGPRAGERNRFCAECNRLNAKSQASANIGDREYRSVEFDDCTASRSKGYLKARADWQNLAHQDH